MKKLLLTLSIIAGLGAAGLGLAGDSFAMKGSGHGGNGGGYHNSGGMGGGMGMSCGMGSGMGGYHRGYSELSKQDQAKLDALVEQHQKDISPLREQLWKDNTKLSVLQGNNPSEATINKLIDNISKSRVQLKAKNNAFAKRIDAEFGDKLRKNR